MALIYYNNDIFILNFSLMFASDLKYDPEYLNTAYKYQAYTFDMHHSDCISPLFKIARNEKPLGLIFIGIFSNTMASNHY